MTWMMAGSMNDRVFPLPVYATPKRSLPDRDAGHAWHWIGDGLSNFGSYANTSIKYWGKPDSLKLWTGLGTLCPDAFMWFSSINFLFSSSVLFETLSCSYF